MTSDTTGAPAGVEETRRNGKRERSGEDTRQLVRRAAARIFLEKGYRDASIQDIANALGMPKGSAYHHIGSKPEVLYDIISDGMRGLVERMAVIVDYPLSARDRLRLALRDNLRSTIEDVHAPVAIALRQEIQALSDEQRREYLKLRVEYQQLYFRLYEEGVASGEFRALADPKIALFGIFGMLSYFQKWFSVDGEKTLNEVADIWLELIMNGIGSPPA
ncbi:hypothetical protein AYO38_01750 [bacterium SCGC AG-212-C10]|nr:hypothetical protein AYO38_01750 [bacterium SCGC AG-212-C10]